MLRLEIEFLSKKGVRKSATKSPEIARNPPGSAQTDEKRLQTDPRVGIKNCKNTEKIDERRLWEEVKSFKKNAEKNGFFLEKCRLKSVCSGGQFLSSTFALFYNSGARLAVRRWHFLTDRVRKKSRLKASKNAKNDEHVRKQREVYWGCFSIKLCFSTCFCITNATHA